MIESMTDALHSYMVFRAKEEGTGHELSREWYLLQFNAGCRLFFGITLNDSGVLLSDEQQPAIFNKWQQKLQQEAGRN